MQKLQMNILKYLAFVKAVEYGSFTEAAAALHYTQSGISRMIGDLEAEWGVSLLERGRAGVRLTSDGLKLLPQLQRICNEHETLLLQVDDLHGMQSGLIRIGTFSSVATHWLPKMIVAFRQDYPKIEFELLIGDYTENRKLDSGGAGGRGVLAAAGQGRTRNDLPGGRPPAGRAAARSSAGRLRQVSRRRAGEQPVHAARKGRQRGDRRDHHASTTLPCAWRSRPGKTMPSWRW